MADTVVGSAICIFRNETSQDDKAMEPKDIPNFDELCELLAIWDEHPEDPYWIQSMQAMNGYGKWLDWMEKNRPEALP